MGLSNWIESSSSGGFKHLGRSIGTYPWLYLLGTLLVTVVSFSGLIFLTQSSDITDFVPLDAPSRVEARVAERFVRPTEGKFYSLKVVVYAKDNGSLTRPDYSREIINFYGNITAVPIGFGNGTATYADVCAPYCQLNDPLIGFLQAFQVLADPFYYPLSTIYGTSLFIGNNVFEVETNATTGAMTGFRQAVMHFFVILKSKNAIVEWEKEIKILSDEFNGGQIQSFLWSEDLISEETDRLGYSTAPLLLISVVILVAFFLITSQRSDPVLSKPWEALTGILVPVIAIGASFGILSFCGIPMQPIIVATLFLVLSVGTDDAFIMMRAWDRSAEHSSELSRKGSRNSASSDSGSQISSENSMTDLFKNESIPERTSIMLEESGTSIAITSLTNLLSFGVGIFSSTPAIRTLCIFSSTAIVVCFVYQIIMYSAVLALSGRRENRRLHSLFCCLRVPFSEKRNRESQFSKTLSNLHDRAINGIVKISQSWISIPVILFLMLIYWAGAVYGLTTIKSDLTIYKLALPDSMLIEYSEKMDIGLKEMQVLSVFVSSPPDLRSAEMRKRVKEMVKEFENAPFAHGSKSTMFWLPDYEEYVEMMDEGFTFTELPSFLETIGYTHWSAMVHLNETACADNQPECVKEFMFTTGFHTVIKFYDRVPVLAEWRQIAEKYSDMNISPFNLHNLFADQSSTIGYTVVTSVLAALFFMALTCFLFIPDLLFVLMAIVSIESVNVGVFGYLTLWGIDMDPLSMAAMLMAVGFSVDYTAHITFHYYKSEKQIATARLRDALNAIGWPMVQCAISTVLAMAPILVRPSYIAYVFFKTVLLVVSFGAFHGLILIPVLLVAVTKKEKVKPFSVTVN